MRRLTTVRWHELWPWRANSNFLCVQASTQPELSLHRHNLSWAFIHAPPACVKRAIYGLSPALIAISSRLSQLGRSHYSHRSAALIALAAQPRSLFSPLDSRRTPALIAGSSRHADKYYRNYLCQRKDILWIVYLSSYVYVVTFRLCWLTVRTAMAPLTRLRCLKTPSADLGFVKLGIRLDPPWDQSVSTLWPSNLPLRWFWRASYSNSESSNWISLGWTFFNNMASKLPTEVLLGTYSIYYVTDDHIVDVPWRASGS